VNWRTPALGTALTLSGTVTVDIWSATNAAAAGRNGSLIAYLRDYNPATGTYVEIANATRTAAYAVGRTYYETPILVTVAPAYTLAAGHMLLATAITVGAGTVGGVFTPTLFLGAGAGALFGGILHQSGHAVAVPAGALALVGMGATLAATTRSPLLAMILIFELSLDYTLVPPLMLACVVSILVARQLHGESVYTEHLRVKGLALGQETSRPGAVMEQTVGDLMRAPVAPLRENTPLRDIAGRFLTSPNNFIPVVDAQQRLLGAVALQDLKEFLSNTQDLDGVIWSMTGIDEKLTTKSSQCVWKQGISAHSRPGQA